MTAPPTRLSKPDLQFGQTSDSNTNNRAKGPTLNSWKGVPTSSWNVSSLTVMVFRCLYSLKRGARSWESYPHKPFQQHHVPGSWLRKSRSMSTNLYSPRYELQDFTVDIGAATAFIIALHSAVPCMTATEFLYIKRWYKLPLPHTILPILSLPPRFNADAKLKLPDVKSLPGDEKRRL